MNGPQDEGAGRAVITKDTLVISLTPENRAAMEACLAKSGKIVLKIDKVEFTTLPGVGSAAHTVSD